jgi:hypothetical protein
MFSTGKYTIKEIATKHKTNVRSVSELISESLSTQSMPVIVDRIEKAKILERVAIEEAEKCHSLRGSSLALQVQKAKNYAYLCATYCA